MANESTLFDDVARVLASPIPRRQALKTLMKGLVGAAAISLFGPEIARADPTPNPLGDPNGSCPGNHFNCHGYVCCNSNTQTCCGVGPNSVCCRPPQQFCVNNKCSSKASPSAP